MVSFFKDIVESLKSIRGKKAISLSFSDFHIVGAGLASALFSLWFGDGGV